MTVWIRIDADNAAFEDAAGCEVARILKEAARRVPPELEQLETIKLYDANGNTVGEMWGAQ